MKSVNRPLIGLTVDVREEGVEKVADSPFCFIKFTYIDAVRASGGLPVLIPALKVPFKENEMEELLEPLDGLLLTGGTDLDPAAYNQPRHPSVRRISPVRTAFELELTRKAYHKGLPVFGICLGMQTMNVALGGSLIQDIASMTPVSPTVVEHRDFQRRNEPVHEVCVAENTLLHRIISSCRDNSGHGVSSAPGILGVNSTHHQAVSSPGKGLVISARAEDGIVEALESMEAVRWPEAPFFLGVQWHPEDLFHSVEHRALFTVFMEACRIWRSGVREKNS